MIPKPDLTYEKKLWKTHPLIAGLDEAGRGALAGPVCVGAVILPSKDSQIIQVLRRVHDSKQLTPLQRSELAPLIEKTALTHGVGFASAEEIDSLGIVPATRLAASRAVAELLFFPQFLLTDFRLELPELDLPQAAIVKGDQKSLSIACASILAKTARDAFMQTIQREYPQYQFEKHKGYGTLVHRQKIAQHGHSPMHRKTFQIKS